MFRIFRKGRKKGLNGRKTRKYLAYALGELVLVVVGILIALQINNAELDRQDRAREKQFMVSMLTDLRSDIGEIDSAVAANSELMDGMNELLHKIAALPREAEAQRDLLVWSIKYTYWYTEAEFSLGALSQLKYSGGFQLIRDEAVKKAILRYERGLEKCDNVKSEIKGYFHVMEASQKQLLNLSLGKLAYELIEQDFMNMLLPIERFEGLVDQGQYLIDTHPNSLNEYYGDVLFYRTTMNNMNLTFGHQKEIAQELIALIRTRYGID
jgi:hypothetical protein